MFFEMREENKNIVGLKELGGKEEMSYEEEKIKRSDDGV